MGEDVVVNWSALKKYYQEILRGRESESGAGRCSCILKSCIHGDDGEKGGYCVKSSTAASPLATLESPVGEGGLVPWTDTTQKGSRHFIKDSKFTVKRDVSRGE